ncbi:MAG TPA: hypothetical protein VI685_08785 [Candidatus Angelobacter sp.]
MNGARLLLKQSSGWFAAGREFAQALALLSDGAFKLYVYACLHADRHTGRLRIRAEALAQALKRSRQVLTQQLSELQDHTVCDVEMDMTFGVTLEVRDRFWPYHKQNNPAQGGASEAEFVRSVRDLFLAPACVQSAFTPADEKIAIHLYRRGITLQQVQRAILLGCARKYISMINHGVRQPIASLQYFLATVDEIVETTISESYWDLLRRKVVRMEQSWKTSQN